MPSSVESDLRKSNTIVKIGGEVLARIHEWYRREEWVQEQLQNFNKIGNLDFIKRASKTETLATAAGAIREVCRSIFCEGPWHRWAMAA